MKQFFKNLGSLYSSIDEWLRKNTSNIIGDGWIFISLIIVLFIFLLGVLAVVLGFLEICLGIYHQDSDFLLTIVSVLKNLLLGFVLIILSRGIYGVVKETIDKKADERAGIAEMNLPDIERNFIGIIILTMLVVVLGLILDHKNVNDILFISAAISALIISLSFYIKHRVEGSKK